jgi:hypothetical protein
MQKLVPEKINSNLKLFNESMKSEYTKKVYTVCLNKYFQFVGSSKNRIIQCDHLTDPRKIEECIIDFVISMKKEGKGYSAIHNYVSGI